MGKCFNLCCGLLVFVMVGRLNLNNFILMYSKRGRWNEKCERKTVRNDIFSEKRVVFQKKVVHLQCNWFSATG